jgi:hypothetical protein
MLWRMRAMHLSYELRRGGNRPGPTELWDRFDAAVDALGVDLEGVALGAIARAFAQLSYVARELAHEIDQTYSQAAARRQAS